MGEIFRGTHIERYAIFEKIILTTCIIKFVILDYVPDILKISPIISVIDRI